MLMTLLRMDSVYLAGESCMRRFTCDKSVHWLLEQLQDQEVVSNTSHGTNFSSLFFAIFVWKGSYLLVQGGSSSFTITTFTQPSLLDRTTLEVPWHW